MIKCHKTLYDTAVTSGAGGAGSGIALRWHEQEQRDRKDNDRRASGVANLATVFPHLAAFQTPLSNLDSQKQLATKLMIIFWSLVRI